MLPAYRETSFFAQHVAEVVFDGSSAIFVGKIFMPMP
jgi:hypothetical protein